MVQVFYNGQDLFANIAPTPFVGVEDNFINYRERFGTIKNINLEGYITGECQNFNFFIDKQNELINRLGSDFQNLEIKENSNTIFSGNYIKVNSIEFGESSYNGLVPFTINLLSYDKQFFTGVWGVTEPRDTTQYSEQSDGTVQITRSFSAKGFNTSNNVDNALYNAINYVHSVTGNSQLIAPKFITSNTSNLIPRNISETIDRLNSVYSVDFQYVYRKGASSSSLLNYTIDISHDEEAGIYTASINGSLSGPIGYSISSLRSDFANFKNYIYSIVYTKFYEITNYNYLNSIPENFNVTENELDNILEFNYSYSSDPYTTKFDPNYQLDYDYIKDLYTLNINGTLTTKGPQKLKENILLNAANSLDIKSLASEFYYANATQSSSPLNLNYQRYSRSFDKTNPQVNINASFDNSPIPPEPFTDFRYTISITPSIYSYSPIQFLNGDNGVFNLNFYLRGNISIQGTAITNLSQDLSSTVRAQANNLLNQFKSSLGTSRVLRVEDKIDRKLQKEENGYEYNFTLTESCETTRWTS